MNIFISNPSFCRDHEEIMNDNEIKDIGTPVIKTIEERKDFIVPCTHQLLVDLDLLKTNLFDPTKQVDNLTTLADMMDLIYLLTYVVTDIGKYNTDDLHRYLSTMSQTLREQSGSYVEGYWLRGFNVETDDDNGEKD